MSVARRVSFWSGGAAALVLAVPVLAQTPAGEPVVISPQVELDWLEFYNTRAVLELEWRTNYDEVEPSGGVNRRNVQNRMREILDLRTQAYVGHPNLLELNLGGRFWFEQQWLKLDPRPTEFVSQFLLDWDVSGLFFKETKLPFILYTRQNTSQIDRQFGSSLKNTFREYGARVNFRSPVAPTTLQIFRREIEQTDTTLDEGFNIDQFTVQGDGRVEFNQNQRLAWDAKYDNVDQTGELRTPRSFERFEGNATHALDFGHEDRSVLRTQFRVLNESGVDRRLQQVRVLPRLRLWHSNDLNSWYDYRFEWDKRFDQEQFTNEATANFQYQVFDSLTMIGNAGVNFFEITNEDFDSNEVFGRMDIQYLKQVPMGALEVGLTGILSTTDQSERGSPLQITDDQNVFSPISFVLNQRNIEASSIVITDLAGVITYTVNVDYLVNAFSDQVQIQQIAGGNLLPNQVVLVDYVIGPDPGGRTDQTGVGIDARYTFQESFLRNVSMYVNYFRQDENRSILTEEFPEDDFSDLRYGIEYDIWKLYFKAERQHRDSTLSPFKAVRLEGRYTEPLGRGSNIVLRALFQEVDRTEEDFRQTTATFSGQWNQRLDNRLNMSLVALYRYTDDNASFDSRAYEGQFDLTWRYRQTEVYTQLRASINDSTFNDTTFARLIVGIRREF